MRPASSELLFTQPTTIDVEPTGTLLLVENNPGRLLRVDPASGTVTPVVSAIARPFAVARAGSGEILLSNGKLLQRVDGSGTLVTLAEAPTEIGPLTIAANGDVYFATTARIYRLAGGRGPPVAVAGTGVEGSGGDGGPALSARLSGPHGLAIGADGALLVSDSGNNRLRRIDLASGVITTLAEVDGPIGMDVAPDGTIYLVESRTSRAVRFSAAGARLGFVGTAFTTPYDLEVAGGGIVYVLEAGPVGRIRRIAPDGTVTTVSHP